VIQTFWVKKVSGNAWETTNSGDYLVGILERDMSVTNGYFSTLQYNSSWNGQLEFDMSSYPTDMDYRGLLQVTQGPMFINSVSGQGTSSELYLMDGIVVARGDFGAPIYRSYGNAYRLIGIVGVQTAYPTSFQVLAQGGPDLWTLIAEARKAYP
jgi:hypothetical protein